MVYSQSYHRRIVRIEARDYSRRSPTAEINGWKAQVLNGANHVGRFGANKDSVASPPGKPMRRLRIDRHFHVPEGPIAVLLSVRSNSPKESSAIDSRRLY
jgi:hypothetical protein